MTTPFYTTRPPSFCLSQSAGQLCRMTGARLLKIWPFRVLCIGLLMLGLNADQAAPNAFQRLQQQIAPLLLLSDSDANYELRSLTFERPEIELIAR